MEVVIDFNQISSSPVAFAIWFIKTIGWIYPVFLFVYGLILVWLNFVRNKYRADRRYILLAIDIPKENLQTPKAVENFFSHLAGAHQDIKPLQKWWDGEIPDSFSLEIISMGGYIQFLIQLVDRYRDLIEAIIYAQYPDAEITEVEDYAQDWKLKFPNEKYQLWGTEIKLTNKEVFPIRTYKEFEHGTSEEYKDTMASMLEGLTRIGPGEQAWVQFVVTPADNDWGKGGKAVVDKIIGRRGSNGPKSAVGKFSAGFGEFVSAGLNPAPTTSTGPKEPPTQMLHLTPGEKADVEAIQIKTSKIGFHVRIRMVYFAEKKKFKKNYGLNVFYGSLKQFNSTSNGFKPDKKIYTGGLRFFKNRRTNWRRARILGRYRHRAHHLEPGQYGFVLNTEELAGVWHFPSSEAVHAPLVRKTEAKRAEPPISLPVDQPRIVRPVAQKTAANLSANPSSHSTVSTPAPAPQSATITGEPPSNLPVI